MKSPTSTNSPRPLAKSSRIWFVASASLVVVMTAIAIWAGVDHTELMRK